MQIEIERELSAMAKFLLDVAGEGTTPYFMRLEEGIKRPAIFFPVPESNCRKVTFSTVKTEMTWRIRYLADDDIQAYSMAADAMEQIILAGNAIPVYTPDGEPAGKIKVGNPHITKLGYGIVQMELSCDRYTGIETGAQKAARVEFTGLGYNQATLIRAMANIAEQYKEDSNGGREEGIRADKETGTGGT